VARFEFHNGPFYPKLMEPEFHLGTFVVCRIAMGDGETVMDEKVRSMASSYESSTDYDYPEWRWWYNMLGLAIVLATSILISWW